MSKKFLTSLTLVGLGADPATGVAGELYYNTTVNTVKVYTGTEWTVIAGGGGTVTVGETAPEAPDEGSLWFDATTGQFFVYYANYWIEVGGGGGDNAAVLEVDGGTYDSIAPYNGGTPFTTYFATKITGGTP
jgi:hypothetical protein